MKLVESDLTDSGTHQFGQRSIHNYLTLEQLTHLQKKFPALAANQTFLETYASRLMPKALARYAGNLSSAPPDLVDEYHGILRDFTLNQLTLPSHTTMRVVLLHYLMNAQFNKDV